ncbi:MAG: DNA-formamidopyrimidine glycosylase family protein [Chthoniobacteraceae bacterium]
MPELAEVEYIRKQWDVGTGQPVRAVEVRAGKRIFRGSDPAALVETLSGAKLLGSESRGKQMLFRFSRGGWLGIHLGMSGHLRVESVDFAVQKHDHLVLRQRRQALVFEDPRMFGRVRFHQGKDAPEWWTSLPPALTSEEFTVAMLRANLARRARSPLKAALLDQALFPGVGNWMADEILWQSRLHPATPAGTLDAKQAQTLWKKTRAICQVALETIGTDGNDPPRAGCSMCAGSRAAIARARARCWIAA